jgi:hypothetical protein
MLPPRVLEPGTTVVMASVDAQKVPSCCRAIAVASTGDDATLTVYVPLATSHDVLRNIATTRRVAITVTAPLTHTSTQLKGTTVDVRLAREDEAAFVHARRDAMAETLDALGLPRRVTGNVSCWPAFAVTARIDEMFDQTPGPNAGAPLR